MNNTTNSMWGGRFEQSVDRLMQAINASIDFDKALYREDIAGSIAHVTMLEQQNIVTQEDRDAIISGLETIRAEIENEEFLFKAEHEDIHLNIENRLKELIKERAGRLHTARSRNDQVATDFKLFVRARIDDNIQNLKHLIATLLDQAEAGFDRPMPGFTHLQVAQPVTWGHHMMAYVEMFARDIERFEDARKHMNLSPLGSAALAGTSFPIDRHMTAKELGFSAPTRNSIDGVSDRDFAIEFLSVASLTATHLSRLSEELVIWSSAQFQFIKISDKWSTGSSIMPQKRNPDAAELIRAKVARINGAWITLSTVMKGLPLAYSKDMQEDKEPVFDAAKSLDIAVNAMKGMITDLTPNFVNLEKAAKTGFSTATDLADWLVRSLNMPFRDAHHVTGTLVKMAENKNIDLPDLTLSDMQSVEAKITMEVFDVLGVDNSVRSRTSYGGTAPENVKSMIDYWREQL